MRVSRRIMPDASARAAYGQRLRDLETELAEATEWADAGRAEADYTENDGYQKEIGVFNPAQVELLKK